MINNIKNLTYGFPIKYKDLNIYPIKVIDYLDFLLYSASLTFEKNSIPDIKVISMTNLEYIYYQTVECTKNNQDIPLLFLFDRLLSLCLREDDSFSSIESSMGRYTVNDKEKPIFTINGKEYSSKDYEEIKSIMCEQNLIELPDETISKEVRDSLEEAKRYKERLAGSTQGTFGDYIVSVASVTGWTFDYIYNLSSRKFLKALRRLDNLIHYKIYLNASMSGMVKFEDTSFIKHWLSNIDVTDKYKDVSMDLEELKGKVSLESAKRK